MKPSLGRRDPYSEWLLGSPSASKVIQSSYTTALGRQCFPSLRARDVRETLGFSPEHTVQLAFESSVLDKAPKSPNESFSEPMVGPEEDRRYPLSHSRKVE